MSSYDEEPPAPRDDPHAYGYPSPSATCPPDVSEVFRNIVTSAQVPRFRSRYADREAAERQTLYAEKEPQRREDALNRWWSLFGVERNPAPQ